MSQIEHYLLLRPDWVSAAELVRTFRVDERELRAHNGAPGLCSSFALSGKRGYKHVRHATDEEWAAFEERIRSHGISELTRVKELRARRNQYLNQAASDLSAARTFDPTGQGQLLS
jgi:hypothetical protein